MTPAEIREAAARDLGLLADGAALNAEDTARLTEKYTALHGMLLEEGLVTWGLTEAVPTKCEVPVVAMLCTLAVGIARVGKEKRAELILLGALHNSPVSLAERQLRKALAGKHVEQAVPSEYF